MTISQVVLSVPTSILLPKVLADTNKFLLLSYDSEFGGLKEVYDGVYLLAGLYLRADLQDAVLKGCLAIKDKAVGIGYLQLLLLPDAGIGEDG